MFAPLAGSEVTGVDDLEERVRRAALAAASSDRVLAPRQAARVEREERRGERRLAEMRIAGLRTLLRRLRRALKDRGDVGTGSFVRHRRYRIARLLPSTRRGWVVASLPAEVVLDGGGFGGVRRSCQLQLVLLTRGRLFAGHDGVLFERYRLGQAQHPWMSVSFPMQAWRDLEDRIPEHVGELVGRLQLTWERD